MESGIVSSISNVYLTNCHALWSRVTIKLQASSLSSYLDILSIMTDFATFKALFKGDIVTPDDADYPKAIARWAVNAQRRAKVVAFVRDEDDVRAAIKYARDSGLSIAIRGGGHSPAGASSSEGGLVIDLSRYLNHARVDPEKRVIYVGGGALWDVVDKEAIKHGLATVGGTVNHVDWFPFVFLSNR